MVDTVNQKWLDDLRKNLECYKKSLRECSHESHRSGDFTSSPNVIWPPVPDEDVV